MDLREKIEAYIKKNYDPEDGAATPDRCAGNAHDVFDDGEAFGVCYTLYNLAKFIGMDVEVPHPQKFD